MLSPKEILQKFWNYSEFRMNQEAIIESILNGKDTFALLPTGGGKSICYQLPALMLPGTCIVISPLLALMKDQIQNLKNKNIKACLLTSEQSIDQQLAIIESLKTENIKLLYISPERITSKLFLQHIQQISISFIAVDEAHCISEWGNDFRPSYQNIASFRKTFNVPILALTATATPLVQKEISEKLQLFKPTIFKNSFRRSNLSIQCIETENKLAYLIYKLSKTQGTKIVYTRTRQEAEYISEILQAEQFDIQYFHAGLSQAEKNKRQENWMQSNTQTLVATNAFGMGIDKDDVTLIIHFSPSYSLENYYQEIGRAGRNGNFAEAILLYNDFDFAEMKGKLWQTIPTKEQYESIIKKIYNQYQIGIGDLPEIPLEFDENKFAAQHKISSGKVTNVLEYLHNNQILYWDKDKSQSKIRIKITSQQLDFIAKNDAYALDEISRKLEGVFTYLVSFNDEFLRRSLHLIKEEYEEMLQRFLQLDYIEYYNGNRKHIRFLQARDDYFVLKRLCFPYHHYNQHKIQKYEELKFYIQTQNYCRMRLILGYFGEKSKENCEICDYCNGKNEQGTQHNHTEKVVQEIQQSPKTLEELEGCFPEFDKIFLIDVLQKLLQQEKITMKDYKTYQVKK